MLRHISIKIVFKKSRESSTTLQVAHTHQSHKSSGIALLRLKFCSSKTFSYKSAMNVVYLSNREACSEVEVYYERRRRKKKEEEESYVHKSI